MDVWQVTIRAPKAKVRKVHLGTIAIGEDGPSLTVESVEAA